MSVTVLALFSFIGSAAPPLPSSAPHTVVVELFTSEGCSSCPPAEKLMSELRQTAERQHQPIFFLAEHVDYWDDLGWTDPLASHDATERQLNYAKRFGLSSVYTPQLVVDGRDQLVGSDRTRVAAAIERAAERNDVYLVAPQAHRVGDKVLVEVSVQTVDAAREPAATLVMALTENDTEQKVTRGENAGSLLHHPAVIRGWKEIPLTSRQLTTAIDATTLHGPGTLVAFVKDDGGILGAGSTAVN